MSKLITAKEAFALTERKANYTELFDKINTEIVKAAKSGRDNATLTFGLTPKEVDVIVNALTEAGFDVYYSFLNDTYSTLKIWWNRE